MEKFETLNELILALMLWITSNTNYTEPKQLPKVEFIEQEKLSEIACKNRSCEIMAYTPITPKYKIYLSNELNPMTDICHRAILMHEIIHVIQEDQKVFLEYDYIGAPWPIDQDEHVNQKEYGVGNGGFSLRSKSKMNSHLSLYVRGMHSTTTTTTTTVTCYLTATFSTYIAIN